MGMEKFVVTRFNRYGIALASLMAAGATQAANDVPPAAEAKPAARASAAEGCLNQVGLGGVQAMKDLAKNFSPEVLMDMMFSSVNPVVQSALLTKSSEPAKPVKSMEDMRDEKYLRDALATVGVPAPWVKVTADGRVIPQLPMPADAASASGWQRFPAQAKPGEAPISTNPYKRY